MKRLIIIVLAIVLGGYGIVAILRGPAREFTASILDAEQSGAPTDSRTASFTQDSDRDGLTDAKEHIYGTNPKKADTDDDGFDDGDEIRKGFDPTQPGDARIEDNEALWGNLTVRYFQWARDVANVDDPQLNDEAVQRFLEAEGLTEAKIPAVNDNELALTDAAGSEALTQYFQALAQIRLPDATASYIDIADEIIQKQQSAVLDDVLAGLTETYEAFRKVPAPPEVREVHREQLAFLKALRNLFSDLYGIDRDPVMLMRDIAWGTDLLERSVELEKKRGAIAATLVTE